MTPLHAEQAPQQRAVEILARIEIDHQIRPRLGKGFFHECLGATAAGHRAAAFDP